MRAYLHPPRLIIAAVSPAGNTASETYDVNEAIRRLRLGYLQEDEVLDDEVERDILPIHDRLRLYHQGLGNKTWLKVNGFTVQRLEGG